MINFIKLIQDYKDVPNLKVIVITDANQITIKNLSVIISDSSSYTIKISDLIRGVLNHMLQLQNSRLFFKYDQINFPKLLKTVVINNDLIDNVIELLDIYFEVSNYQQTFDIPFTFKKFVQNNINTIKDISKKLDDIERNVEKMAIEKI